MSRRTSIWLAWLLWAVGMLFVALGLYFGIVDAAARPADTTGFNDIGPLVLAAELAILTVGALVASRRPRNPIGWILLAAGLVMTLGDFAGGYAVHGLLARPGSLPGALFMAWLTEWTHGLTLIGAFALVFLLFPDGRPLSPRWRPIVWLAVAITPLVGLTGLKPGPLNDYPLVANPFGIGGAAGRVVGIIANAAFFLLLLSLLLAAVSLILRFRRARGDERQQLKWFASGGAFVALAFLVAPVIWFTPAFNGMPVWPILFVLALVAIPMSIGVAILKYRLYDIDLIIRRTLLYSIITLLLALAYFGSVVVLQSLVRLLTGQNQSQVITVVSTLVIAALFVPVRGRVQEFIDRRFYRRNYDAARILAAFSNSVRDEVELGRLAERLIEVVDETLQPETVSLWIRGQLGPGVNPGQAGAGIDRDH